MINSNDQDPTASDSAKVDATPTNSASQPPPMTGGFLVSHIAIMSVLFRGVRVGHNLMEDTMQIIHVPQKREFIRGGFELLANTQGLAFKQLCDLWNYDHETFIEAVEKYIIEQDRLMAQFEQAGEAQPQVINTKDLPPGFLNGKN